MTIALTTSAPAQSAVKCRPDDAATRSVAALLQTEAAIELALLVWAYQHLGGSWLLFAAFFLAPDLSMAGYLADVRFGAMTYNLAHTYIIPALLGLCGLVLSTPALLPIALIWVAHISFDRLIGYGLKYPSAFGATHLGWKGTSSGPQ